MNTRTILHSIREKLTGYKASHEELQALSAVIPTNLVPNWLIALFLDYPLSRSSFSLTPEEDESGLGVEMQWMTPQQIVDEATSAYPGIAAVELGYVPVGTCLEGSGDPYFLAILASEDPPLVRVPHEAVNSEGVLNEKRIETISKTLSNFFKKAKPE